MSENKKWNFDEVIDRTGTRAIKWDQEFMKEYFKVGDLLPLWVADMDFRAPEALINALKKRADHGIFGYTLSGDPYKDAVVNWFQRRHNWAIEKDWLLYAPGVVPAVKFIIQTFTRPGDKIIIQEPVYYPFKTSIQENGRIVLNNQLVIKNNRYEIDFKDLEEKCKTPRVKMLILCSPHNPIARVWTKEELTKIGKICNKHNVLVLSDEIHCDLIFPGHEHIPYASISKKFAENSITCTAPSKTFNIAGLKASNTIISNKQLRDKLTITMQNISIMGPSIFGGIALETVYNDCEDWLDDLLVYLKSNYDFLVEFIKENMPGVEVFDLEGTYLAWVDFRKLGIDAKKLDEIIKQEAKVGLDDGAMFGESGGCFQRVNLACPKSILEEALVRIQKALTPYVAKLHH